MKSADGIAGPLVAGMRTGHQPAADHEGLTDTCCAPGRRVTVVTNPKDFTPGMRQADELDAVRLAPGTAAAARALGTARKQVAKFGVLEGRRQGLRLSRRRQRRGRRVHLDAGRRATLPEGG